jgi:hypothetical protein
MTNDLKPCFFHRQFSLESFKKFLGPGILVQLTKHLGTKRRKRLLGFEGFLWLGLFMAAHAASGSLQHIFTLAATLNSHLLTASVISVSGFCQYRSFFPSETVGLPLEASRTTSLSGSSSVSTAVARVTSLCA